MYIILVFLKLQASGYFRAKQVQEDMIMASGVPYTIGHATQFFEFAGAVLQMSIVDGKVLLPNANIQPIASKDVAAFLAQTAVAQPANTVLEIGGPEKFAMAAWISQYALATHKNHDIETDTNALYSGAPLDADTLPPESPVYLGPTKYAALDRRTSKSAVSIVGVKPQTFRTPIMTGLTGIAQ